MVGYVFIALVTLCGGVWLYFHLLKREQSREARGHRKRVSRTSEASNIAASLQQLQGGSVVRSAPPWPPLPVTLASQSRPSTQRVVPSASVQMTSVPEGQRPRHAASPTATAPAPRRLQALTWIGDGEMVEVAGVSIAAPMAYFADSQKAPNDEPAAIDVALPVARDAMHSGA